MLTLLFSIPIARIKSIDLAPVQSLNREAFGNVESNVLTRTGERWMIIRGDLLMTVCAS